MGSTGASIPALCTSSNGGGNEGLSTGPVENRRHHEVKVDADNARWKLSAVESIASLR